MGRLHNAALDTLRSLVNPTPDGDWTSAAVYSADNPYGIDQNLMYSFPLRSSGGGNWEIVEGLELSDYASSKIKASEEELLGEREAIADLL